MAGPQVILVNGCCLGGLVHPISCLRLWQKQIATLESNKKPKMTKKKDGDSAKSMLVYEVDPTECPFREFKDNELSAELWGLGPAACRAAILLSGKTPKPPIDFVWVDDQTQPLPRSIRHYLHGWIRAEDLASDRWDCDVVVFEENNGSGKMSVIDMQLSHTQVLMRSSFCRKVLSACFMLERAEGLTVEHQWDNFVASFVPEGWRARYHIYSPGMKPGGGPQHRPGLSKNGCYLVRLFYLGTWRCVWVNDQIPVDARNAPLLPFSPLLSHIPSKPGAKGGPTTVISNVVFLWPLLICKALLKLAAPDMNSDEDINCVEDELMPEFEIMHALTGCLNLNYPIRDYEGFWKVLTSEVPVFSWDDDDETIASTVKSKTKKTTTKETISRTSMTTILIEDSKHEPPYMLPGITPGHEMSLIVTMARDLPLKKPLPEPEVALWKYYRWVDWARRHGLYEAYDCPRTKYLKVNGLMKLSYAPHLLDVMSTESITFGFREEHDKTTPAPKKGGKGDVNRSQILPKTTPSNIATQGKEELREWIQFDPIQKLIKNTSILYFPSMFEFTTAASCPPTRVTKSVPNRALDIIAPKGAPLYLQIDGPNENNLRLSLSMLHPRILINSGIPIVDYIEPAYFILEKFDWFVDCEIPTAKAFVQTRGFDSVEVKFLPGRHYCRLWVHSRLNWHVMLLSESTLLLGTRDVIQSAAVRECPWASRFLTALSTAFGNWIRGNRSNPAILTIDRDFFKSYQPDLNWEREAVGYNQALLHWMFRQALQSLLYKRLSNSEYHAVCSVFRHYFCDPDFGLPPKPAPSKSLRVIVALDPCDCVMPEVEAMEEVEEYFEEEVQTEEKPIVSPSLMAKLLAEPLAPVVSQVCELATEELPCGILKEEREKMICKHEAATIIQSYWRGTWARKCLREKLTFTPEILKAVMDNAFGTLESLSALMNEFFGMYPGAKTAYSVASALSGVNSLFQHHGSSVVGPRCKWIPYFQGVFYCHSPVKVHIDVQSNLKYSTVMAYNNDTGLQMPQAYNAHITFDFSPNNFGYTVMGHGTLSKPTGVNSEAHWQLTVLTSNDGAFHICDNDFEGCKEQPMQGAYKLHIDEIFLPNRRNIVGGILISVTKIDAISFRAAATSPELNMVATLRSTTQKGEIEEIAQCNGKGEIHWPYIRLQPFPSPDVTLNMKKKSISQANLAHMAETGAALSSRSLPKSKAATKSLSAKTKSVTKLKPLTVEPKQYSIEVTTPNGWPLTLAQWRRVDEVRNSVEIPKVEVAKKPTKDKPSSAKDKDKEKPAPTQTIYTPQADDAYIELECSLAFGGGAVARRDDLRDLQFTAARKEWDAKEPGRNLRGAQIRKDFRAEFLEALPPPPSETMLSSTVEDILEEIEGEEYEKKDHSLLQQGPTPATESGMLEMTVEVEEEAKYLLMPEQLKDKFIPLHFLPFCMKEKNEEESVLVTSDMAEAAKQDRHARIEAALERMRELQSYNEHFVLGRQKRRCQLLESLFVDSQWCQELAEALEERDEAVIQETLNRTLSANKKKQELKKKDDTKKNDPKKK